MNVNTFDTSVSHWIFFRYVQCGICKLF